MGSSPLSLERVVSFTPACESWDMAEGRWSGCMSLLQARSCGLDPSTILGAHHAHYASNRDMTSWTADSNEALCLQLGSWQFSDLLATDSLVSESGGGL